VTLPKALDGSLHRSWNAMTGRIGGCGFCASPNKHDRPTRSRHTGRHTEPWP